MLVRSQALHELDAEQAFLVVTISYSLGCLCLVFPPKLGKLTRDLQVLDH